ARGGLQKAKAADIDRLKDEESLMRLKNIGAGSDAASRLTFFEDSRDSEEGPGVLDVVKWVLGGSKD
ncbi:MAG: hypothetical protein ACLP5H_11460, partial [Desulfomonilaceae bacterium]